MSNFEIVASSSESTVVAEYTPEQRKSTDYQSEAELERDFIDRLVSQGYEYLPIKCEQDLIDNLRAQLEKLNGYTFFDKEWNDFYSSVIANGNDGILEKTHKIQEDYIQILTMDNGYTKNIKLIDKTNIHNNHLQVINQYEECNGTHDTRYDVTILVNGFPLVHIELKKRGNAIREAFNQINRYQRDSFWAGSGLFQYVQLFVISNGTHTKYYSNTTRFQHIKDNAEKNAGKKKKTSNSFEFTSYWADEKNRTIPDMVDFTKTFFAKHTLLNILIRYCVFTSENLLLVMRPYQIAATEKILNRIVTSTNARKTGKLAAGGYIWHTTGSGKTLTSFKTAQLARGLKISGRDVEKVLFVVDRKDLDYQTMKEYDRFEKGAANSNTSTKILEKQMADPEASIIITTIQKLDRFIAKNKTHEVYTKHVVLIFDECHRSQFGDMHKAITKHFKNYHIFGFTGTPIFTANSGSGKHADLKTTEQAFGDKLHTYTIVDAIHDGNVLPFRIDYINTVKNPEILYDKQVKAIDREKALLDPQRVTEITGYILTHFEQKTYRNQSRSYYDHKVITNVAQMAGSKNNSVEEKKETTKVNGFNSIFAVASIPAAMEYYKEFKKQMEETSHKLNIATIYSFNPNEEDPDDILQDENFDTSGLDQTSRDFLESAIQDYNEQFNVSYDTSADKFPNYYKDVSLRMKNREIDLLIVVNMFLTGFDATTLNTLWVDKNLRDHGLIQAFSRTNRILNSVKTFGNIVCFRNLEESTNHALSLFGDKETKGMVLLKTYDEYINGYEENGRHIAGYAELIEQLTNEFPLGIDIVGEEAEKAFIRLFGHILRLKNILLCFDEFAGNEDIPVRDFQDYQSRYIDLYQNYVKKGDAEKERINDDIVFEIELIKQVEVNIDYILMLVAKYHDSNCQDKSILADISKSIDASVELRSKKALIEGFIAQMTVKTDVDKDWIEFVKSQRDRDLEQLISEERLKPEETKKIISNAFRDGEIKTTGTDIDKILPPISRFSGTVNRAVKKQTVIDKLKVFFDKYFGLL
ncbi:MAG: type I restriction endonuclease subunit R [Eubacteriales bacterium]|nr:type I restriction endonuclease subunit R [Eubacteriales bacterium]